MPKVITPETIPNTQEEIEEFQDNPSLVRDYILNLPDGYSLYFFCKVVMQYDDMVPHVHGLLCEFLEHSRYGRFRDATVPRSFFKTSIATIAKSIWLPIKKNRNMRILIAMNTADNAAKRVFTIKQHWQKNELLKQAFPELVPDFKHTRWSNACADINRTRNTEEGTYESIGAGGAVVSRHYDHIIEDDLVYAKKDDLTGGEIQPNQEDIEKAIGWHKLSYSLFAHPAKSTLDNIGTRWSVYDLKEWIAKNERRKFKFFFLRAEKTDKNNNLTGEPIWPERFSKETLDDIRSRQGPYMYCTPNESPVLMADWSHKSIGLIKKGEEVIGFKAGEGYKKRRLVKTKVKNIHTYLAPVYKITMESGRTVRCTKEHKWYTGRHDKTHRLYKPAKVGSRLCFVAEFDNQELNDEKKQLAYWLGGFFDGEGSCSGQSIWLHQSHFHNPEVCSYLENTLTKLGYDWNKNITVRSDKRFKTLNSYSSSYWINGGFEAKRKFINECKPVQRHKIENSLFKRSSRFVKFKDKVLSIEPDGTEPVFGLETETGNYIVWGYASSNSTQYLNFPKDPTDALFNPQWLQHYDSVGSIPKPYQTATFVDLALWGDTKGRAKNVILTLARDCNNHIWLLRYDRGKYNPTEIIDLIKVHSSLFKSTVYVEEVYYQKSIRHFAKKDMEATGNFYNIKPLKRDGSKNAKDIRIKTVQPVAYNGALHIRPMMKDFITEYTDYPAGVTCDILDCVGYAVQRKLPRKPDEPERQALKSPFMLDEILEDIKDNSYNNRKYPISSPLVHVN